MIVAVNLLPDTYRKATPSSLQQFHRSPLAIGLVSVLVGLGLLLVALRGVNQFRLARLMARVNTLAPKQQAIGEAKAALAALREQQRTLAYLEHQRSHWAVCLNVLSDVIPAGLWLTGLTLDPQNTLVLDGMAIDQGGEGMTPVTQFVQALKADPRLAGVVREIQVEGIKNIQDGQIGLMKFTLTCSLVNTAPAPSTS